MNTFAKMPLDETLAYQMCETHNEKIERLVNKSLRKASRLFMNTFANSLRLHLWQERYERDGRSIDVRRHIVQTRVGLVWPVVKLDDGRLMMKGEKWPDEHVADTYTVEVGCDASNPDTRIDYL